MLTEAGAESFPFDLFITNLRPENGIVYTGGGGDVLDRVGVDAVVTQSQKNSLQDLLGQVRKLTGK